MGARVATGGKFDLSSHLPTSRDVVGGSVGRADMMSGNAYR